jgi:polyisoprenyl-phosphate glycosyltransferase
MDVSVVIPVFRGEKTLQELFRRIKDALEGTFSFEVVFVHDGGSELSWEIICELKNAQRKFIKAIRLDGNYGQHNAILCGIEYSEANLIITMDEDLQHAPEDIISLINCQKENNSDLVYGYYIKRNHSIIRNIASYLLKAVLRRTIKGLHKDYSSFRLIKTDPAIQITKMKSLYSFIDGYLAQLNIKVNSIPVYHFKSNVGVSSYSMKKLLKHTLFIFLSFSKYPMKFFKRISLFSFLFFVSYGVYVMCRKLFIADILSLYSVVILLLSFGVGLFFFGLWKLGWVINRFKELGFKEPKFIVVKII